MNERPAVADIPNQPTPPPPGWYDDGKGGKRWWDGTDWAEARQAAPVKKDQLTGAAILGYGLALFMPLIGLIVGVALIARGNTHGAWVTLASIIFTLLYLSMLAG